MISDGVSCNYPVVPDNNSDGPARQQTAAVDRFPYRLIECALENPAAIPVIFPPTLNAVTNPSSQGEQAVINEERSVLTPPTMSAD